MTDEINQLKDASVKIDKSEIILDNTKTSLWKTEKNLADTVYLDKKPTTETSRSQQKPT